MLQEIIRVRWYDLSGQYSRIVAKSSRGFEVLPDEPVSRT